MSGQPMEVGGHAVRDGRLRLLAWMLALVAILVAVATVAIAGRGDPAFTLDGIGLAFVLDILLFPIIGALIVQRRPGTRIAWLMIAIGVAIGVGLVAYGYGVIAIRPVPSAPPGAAGVTRSLSPLVLLTLATSQLYFLPAMACFVVLMLIYPTDRLLSQRWMAVAAVAVVGALLYDAAEFVRPGELEPGSLPGLVNPYAAPASWGGLLDALLSIGNTGLVIAGLLAAFSLVVRYRKADRVEAAQIRWIALVGVLATPAFALGALQAGAVSDAGFGLGMGLLGLFPVATGIAVTRYHLFEIDRLINRAIVYGALTALLAGVFTASITLSQRLFLAVTGAGSDAAIVLTTLVVTTSFAPLRKRVEAIVDRYFKYDVRQFGAYRDELVRILGIVEPARAAQRLAGEACVELRATGAAVVDEAGEPTATAGSWPVAEALRIAIPGGVREFAAIVVGPRLDGSEHDPDSVAQLREVAGLAARALVDVRAAASAG